MQAPPPLPDLPDFITSHFDPFTASDDTVDIDGGTLGMVTTQLPPMQTARPDAPLGSDPAAWEGRVSRNAPCPCGSGRKYKHCHGALERRENDRKKARRDRKSTRLNYRQQ